MTSFVDQIATNDAVGAKQTMSDMLAAKAFQALDARKREIASTLFGGINQEEQETEEQE